jgi:MFS transporter, FSR family, fosmidomycin resistance protein
MIPSRSSGPFHFGDISCFQPAFIAAIDICHGSNGRFLCARPCHFPSLRFHGDVNIQPSSAQPLAATRATMPILLALSLTHFLNDLIQSMIPAIYPLIKEAYHLDYGQIGIITLTFQLTASIFQPVVGHVTDKHPMPYSSVAGMGSSLVGLIVLANAGSYSTLLIGAALVGLGSSIFHPEATRLARHASGGQLGLAQGIFQVGGQSGGALGPLLAAFIVVPKGQASLAWFSVAALIAMGLMVWTARWQTAFLGAIAAAVKDQPAVSLKGPIASKAGVAFAMTILVILLLSKNAYAQSFNSFYTFYLIGKFNVSVQTSQVMLFLFLVAAAAGVIVGGMVGDRIGRDKVIWFSILGALPFTLVLPHVDLFWTVVLTIIINLIMSSAFASILIYAMELVPSRIGMIGGLFYGLTFGLGGLAAAVLGEVADRTSIETVYQICAFMPAAGLLAWFLPKLGQGSGIRDVH